MALDPRIALSAQTPDIPTPDFLRTLLGASQIQQSRQQQQFRAMQMRRAQEEEAQERRLLEYLRQKYPGQAQAGGGQPAPSTPVDAGPITQTTFGGDQPAPGLLPDVVPNVQDPSQPATLRYAELEALRNRPSYSNEEQAKRLMSPPGARQPTPDEAAISPTITPPPGATQPGPMPMRAPEEMQPRSVAGTAPLPVSQPAAAGGVPGAVPAQMPTQAQGPQPLDWRDLLRPEFGPKGLEYAQVMQQVEAGQSLAGQRQMETVVKQVDALQAVLPMIVDQQSLDKYRAMSPALAAALPETYNEQAINQWIERTRQLKARLGGKGAGLQGYYFQTPEGLRLGQLSPEGTVVETKTPQGWVPAPPNMRIDTGTGTMVVPSRGSGQGQEIPKNVYGEAQQKEQGKGDVEELRKLETSLRSGQSLMATMDRKQRIAEREIEKALTALRAHSTTNPVAGFWGEKAANAGVLQDAVRLREALATIKNNLGLQELEALKGSGTSLGQVTEAEHALLQKVETSLAQGLDTPQLWENLEQLYTTLRERRAIRQEAYQRDQARAQQLQRGGGSQGGGGTSREPQAIPRSQIPVYMKQYGKTAAEVEAIIRANPNYKLVD